MGCQLMPLQLTGLPVDPRAAMNGQSDGAPEAE